MTARRDLKPANARQCPWCAGLGWQHPASSFGVASEICGVCHGTGESPGTLMSAPQLTERDRGPYAHELPAQWRAIAEQVELAPPAADRPQLCRFFADELEAALQNDNDDCASAHLEAARLAREDVLAHFEALAGEYAGLCGDLVTAAEVEVHLRAIITRLRGEP